MLPANAVILPLDRHEVAHAHQLFAVLCLAAEGNHALGIVIVGNPLKAWNFEKELEWGLLQYQEHQDAQNFFKAVNHFYLQRPELWEIDFDWVPAAEQGVHGHVPEHIVHPAHVPLVVKAQPAHKGGF